MSENQRDDLDYSDEEQVAKGKKKFQIRRQQEQEDIRQVLSTPAGQALIWRIMDQSKMLAPNMFTGNSTTFYNLGSRDLGLWLYNEIMEAAPNAMLKMMQNQLKKDEDNG